MPGEGQMTGRRPEHAVDAYLRSIATVGGEINEEVYGSQKHSASLPPSSATPANRKQTEECMRWSNSRIWAYWTAIIANVDADSPRRQKLVVYHLSHPVENGIPGKWINKVTENATLKLWIIPTRNGVIPERRQEDRNKVKPSSPHPYHLLDDARNQQVQ